MFADRVGAHSVVNKVSFPIVIAFDVELWIRELLGKEDRYISCSFVRSFIT